jgi:hypothetical protein
VPVWHVLIFILGDVRLSVLGSLGLYYKTFYGSNCCRIELGCELTFNLRLIVSPF